MKKLFCLFLITLASATLFSSSRRLEGRHLEEAFNTVHFGEPTYAGTGCSSGTMSHVLDPESTSLSLLPDEFLVESEGDAGSETISKSCTVTIPVDIPEGVQVAMIGADYRGAAVVTCPGDWAEFEADYTVGGHDTTAFVKEFVPPFDDDYTIANTLEATDLHWSGCGGHTELVVKTKAKLHVEGVSSDDDGSNDDDGSGACDGSAYIGIDSEDLSNRPESAPEGEKGHVYELVWQTCEFSVSGASSVSGPSSKMKTAMVVAATAAAVLARGVAGQ